MSRSAVMTVVRQSCLECVCLLGIHCLQTACVECQHHWGGFFYYGTMQLPLCNIFLQYIIGTFWLSVKGTGLHTKVSLLMLYPPWVKLVHSCAGCWSWLEISTILSVTFCIPQRVFSSCLGIHAKRNRWGWGLESYCDEACAAPASRFLVTCGVTQQRMPHMVFCCHRNRFSFCQLIGLTFWEELKISSTRGHFAKQT